MNIVEREEIAVYKDDRVIDRWQGASGSTHVAGGDWNITRKGETTEWHYVGGTSSPVAVGRSWTFEPWSPEVYVFMPAGAYNGNRFESVRMPYSPRVPEERLKGVDTPPLITDVPRLGEDSPRIQLLSGDLAFPAFGYFDARHQTAWLAWAQTPADVSGWLWEIEEQAGLSTFRVLSPGVRQSPVYLMPMMQRESPDRGWSPAPGEARTLTITTESWDCADVPAFFDHVWEVWSHLARESEVPPDLPFSEAVRLIETHYHQDSWAEDPGLFRTDCNPQSPYMFQTGWCGGIIATWPLLASENEASRTRATKNIEVFFRDAVLPNGLFYGKYLTDRGWIPEYAHDESRPYTHRWTLTRRQGDALWFLLRQMDLIERSGTTVPTPWLDTLRCCAQTFVNIWRANDQFGHFLDSYFRDASRAILIGDSTSGAIVPAALIAAWQRFKDDAFLEVACESGEFFHREFVRKGVTTGGPGDALQNPDSESCAALIESYATLHAATGDARWLQAGRDTAALLATWVVPYAFPFPADSEFGRISIHSRGAVFANTQNKHAAPGICTHAGAGLLYFFRATGDERFMELLTAIARFIPQTVSRPDRPIHDKTGRALPSGWINERVNTSDWDDNIGGVFYGSCWCEVSMLLTAFELPGVYVRPDTGRVWALDHVTATLEGGELTLSNPTPFPAEVNVLVDRDPSKPLPSDWFVNAPTTLIPAQGTAHIPVATP